jgi:hypothetical protein
MNKKMTQTWIIFSINSEQVYQIQYNGCTGQDVIDGYKTMVAGQYKVKEDDVKISFSDDLKATPVIGILKTKEIIVSSELVKDTLDELKKDTYQN